MNVCNNEKNHYLYFVQPGDSLSKVLRKIHGTSLGKQREFELLAIAIDNNPQIANLNLITPGVCLDLSPYRKPMLQVNRWRFDSVETARIYAKVSESEKRAIERYSGALSFFIGLAGAAGSYFGAYKSAVTKQLKYINTLIEDHGKLVIQLAKDRMSQSGGTISQQLVKQLSQTGSEIKLTSALNELSGTIKTGVLEVSSKAPSLIKTSLNRVQKGLLRIPETAVPQYMPFAEYLANGAKLTSRAARVNLATAVVVPLALGSIELAVAKPAQRGRVGSKVAGGVIGGSLGGGLAYGLCTTVFLAHSGGTSLLWCGLVAGGTGGLLGGLGAEAIATRWYDNQISKTGILESEKCYIPTQAR